MVREKENLQIRGKMGYKIIIKKNHFVVINRQKDSMGGGVEGEMRKEKESQISSITHSWRRGKSPVRSPEDSGEISGLWWGFLF